MFRALSFCFMISCIPGAFLFNALVGPMELLAAFKVAIAFILTLFFVLGTIAYSAVKIAEVITARK